MSPISSYSALNASMLIVEDDPIALINLQRYLSPFFKKVWVCDTTSKAWEMYETYRPEIIVSDIELPHTNGLDFIRRIRKDDDSTIIFIVSAFPKETYLLDAIPLKLEAFLIKPITSQKLESIVATCRHYFFKQDVFFGFDNAMHYSFSKKAFVTQKGDIALTHLEIIIFEKLLNSKNSILSYTELENVLSSENSFSRSSLRVLIARLRKKHPLICIDNFLDEGYMLRC